MLFSLLKRARATLRRLASKAANCTVVKPVPDPAADTGLNATLADVLHGPLSSDIEVASSVAFASAGDLSSPSSISPNSNTSTQSHPRTVPPSHAAEYDPALLSPYSPANPEPFAYAGFIPAPSCSNASADEYDHDRALANWYKVKAAIRVARAFRQPATSTPEVIKSAPPPTLRSQHVSCEGEGVRRPVSSSMVAVCSVGSQQKANSNSNSNSRSPPLDRINRQSNGSSLSDLLTELQYINQYSYYNYDEEPRWVHDAAHDMYFNILGRLGRGSFGTVQLAYFTPDLKSTSFTNSPQNTAPSYDVSLAVPCAIKIMNKERIYFHRGGRCGVRQEERALKRATQSGLKCLTTVWATWDDRVGIYCAMPLYHGDLADHILSPKLRDPKRLQLLIAELILAVHNLHTIGIMHRDIKPANILVSSTGHIALGDYGLAYVHHTTTPLYGTPASDHRPVVLKDYCGGTDAYLAPEVVECSYDARKDYTCKADVWAIGLVIYELVLGLEWPWFAEPWTVRSERLRARERGMPASQLERESRQVREATFGRVQGARFDWEAVEEVDPKLADLLKYMLKRRPKQRISAKQAFHAPYFEGIDWETLGHEDFGPLGATPRPRYRRDTSMTFRSFDKWECDEHGAVLVPAAVESQMAQDAKYPKAHQYVNPRLAEEVERVRAEEVERVRAEEVERVRVESCLVDAAYQKDDEEERKGSSSSNSSYSTARTVDEPEREAPEEANDDGPEPRRTKKEIVESLVREGVAVQICRDLERLFDRLPTVKGYQPLPLPSLLGSRLFSSLLPLGRST